MALFLTAAARELPAVDCVLANGPHRLPAFSYTEPAAPSPARSALPTPLPADSFPPLLDWVTNVDMRPTAVMSIFEEYCSQELRWVLETALQIAKEEDRDKHGGSLAESFCDTAPWMTSAHVALAALEFGYRRVYYPVTDTTEFHCCKAVAGVLLHAAGLSLERCAVLLAERAVQERRRAAERRPPQKVQLPKGGGPAIRYFRHLEHSTPETLHLIMQAYRWSVFTGACVRVHTCARVYPPYLYMRVRVQQRLVARYGSANAQLNTCQRSLALMYS